MKIAKFWILALLSVSMFTFTSCDEDPDPMPMDDPKDIIETASETDDLSILVDAIEQAGLVDALKSDGPFTVFAPNNAAFQALLDSNDDWNSLADIDNDLLKTVLEFHVLAADVKAADLSDVYVTTIAGGPNDEQIILQIDVTGGVKFNGSAEPITTDVETTNGTVHIINEVMLPPTVVDFALNNPNFSSLVAALTRADLTTEFVTILNGDGPFTVFAPDNAAFQALLDSNDDWNELGDIPVEVLDSVLKYHVISGLNVQSDELTEGEVPTLLGQDLTVDLSDGAKLTTASGQSVRIVTTDLQGINGVVHSVESVLVPTL